MTVLVSTIRCPRCGATRDETMPLNRCQIRYECPACGVVLRPNQGDCCVFCSYGSLPCPSQQEVSEVTGGETADRDGAC
jgi:hypothetical protein